MDQKAEQFFASNANTLIYLDLMKESAPGVFREKQLLTLKPATDKSLLLDLAVEYDRCGNADYNERRYRKALVWFTGELKLLWLAEHPLQYGDPFIAPSPMRAVAHYNRGNTYDELEKYRHALGDYDCAFKLRKPYPWQILNNRAHVLEKQGLFIEAEQELRKAIASAPSTYPQAELALRRVQSKLARGYDKGLFGAMWRLERWAQGVFETLGR